jgi:hypothetical protein
VDLIKRNRKYTRLFSSKSTSPKRGDNPLVVVQFLDKVNHRTCLVFAIAVSAFTYVKRPRDSVHVFLTVVAKVLDNTLF